MLDKQIFCRELSRQSGEELLGTVGTRRAWLLLQDHSAWAVQAYAGCDLPQGVRDHLGVYFGKEKPDILLIRNSDEKRLETRKAFVAVTRNSRTALYEFAWQSADDLMEIPYAEILAGHYDGKQAAPIYLVCTHGRRDKCCAKYGLPVYQHLRATLGDRVWRASHVGGDRFAANLVCFPHGIYYGRVSPQQALELVKDYEAGELHPELMRGRSSYPKLTQAAEILVRRWSAIRANERLIFRASRPLDEGLHQVDFLDRESGDVLRVRLEVTESEFANHLTCRADHSETIPLYRPRNFEILRENSDVLPT